ncbi:MAG: ABC-F family ATP-binding cassette domain-containing protein [Candidatus Cloacimonetes bacterium]|nr:ABC-F family ATP-binding cassette domain-containing protein [Candidatus Cloacimonadota bacterium]
MSLIRARDLSLEFGGSYILSQVNASLEQNSRVGLIGTNGSGKTTLIRLFLGLLRPTSGEVLRARNCRIAWLPQDLKLDPKLTLLEHVRASRQDLISLSDEIERLSRELAQDHKPETEARLNQCVERYTSLGGYEFENELKYVLTSLNLPPETWLKPCGDFSGGEQTRICLAAILLLEHDLLILDEPTNHLDLEMIAWLEKYLLKQGKPFLIVSHDRQFLDNTVSSVWCLRDSQINVTKGNYSSFKAADEIARLSQERQYERQQKLISETQAYIQKFIAGTRTSSARSRQKMLARMEIVKKPGQQKQLRLPVAAGKRSGNDVYTLKDLSFGIPPELELAREVDLKAHYQDRICVLGPNGCGKTTLLNILLGEHEIMGGSLKTGASLDIGYYDQHQVNLDDSLSVMETIWQLVPQAPRGYVLSWLARFGFRGDDVDKKVRVLSGGERSRLFLCQMIHDNPNLMILDEPTNHLDIDMTDALLAALKDYSGTIIFVSHDRWFLSELATKFWVFRKKASPTGIYTTVEEPDCDWQKAIELAFEEPEIAKAPPPPRERKKKINPWYLEQIHQNIEQGAERLSALRGELDQVHAELSRSETYSEPGRLSSLQNRMAELESKIVSTRAQIEAWEEQYLRQSYEE